MTIPALATTCEITDDACNAALKQQQEETLETLAVELRRLLVRHHHVLTEEGVRQQMETLEHWLEAEQKGPAPANVISESGVAWLTALHDRLKLSADEMLRLEGEGGNPASTEQAEKVEELLKTVRRIEKIIDDSTHVKSH